MNFLKRLFGEKAPASGAVAADRARSQQIAGRETGQTVDEQASTRNRMEAEMEAQRRSRDEPTETTA